MLLNKYKFPLFVAIGLLVAGAVGFAVSYGVSNSYKTESSNAVVSKKAALGAKENPYEIALTKSQKEPIDILINVGDYVQFNSKDGGEHQIIQGKPTVDHASATTKKSAYYANANMATSSAPRILLADDKGGEGAATNNGHDNGASALDSGVIKADEGYSVQFKNIGKYEFHDNYNHDYMITVIVYDKNKKPEDTKIQ